MVEAYRAGQPYNDGTGQRHHQQQRQQFDHVDNSYFPAQSQDPQTSYQYRAPSSSRMTTQTRNDGYDYNPYANDRGGQDLGTRFPQEDAGPSMNDTTYPPQRLQPPHASLASPQPYSPGLSYPPSPYGQSVASLAYDQRAGLNPNDVLTPPPRLSSLPRRHGAISPAPSFGDGVHPDRPLNWQKLSEEQRKMASTFPEDLDEEGSSMWASAKKMAVNWRKWVKWRYWYYYVALILIALLVALMTIYHHQIIDWLTPISKKVNSVKWGWIIPVAILFVISFPPLFGHEIVAILCGVVYPLWIAFGIVSLGTLLGELGNFWAFKWCFRRVAEKYERKSLNYACMAHIVREGGFFVILIARLSAIPGHFTTAVFATVGMNIFIFTLAAVLSTPKQLAVVYVGVAIAQSGTGTESTKSKAIKYVVIGISFVVTVVAAWYLYDKMEKARPIVQARLKAKRYTMLSQLRKQNGVATKGDAVIVVDEGEADTSMISHKEEKPDDGQWGVHDDGGHQMSPLASPYAQYPPPDARQANAERRGSRASWKRWSLVGSQGARRQSSQSNSNKAWHLRGGSTNGAADAEDSEAQQGMLGLAAPLASRPYKGNGGLESTESLVQSHSNDGPTSPRYEHHHHPSPLLPGSGDAAGSSPMARPTTTLEPLDMDVLLAATTKPSSRSPAPLDDYESRSTIPPPAHNTARYRQATDGGYSLYSLGEGSTGTTTQQPVTYNEQPQARYQQRPQSRLLSERRYPHHHLPPQSSGPPPSYAS